jgi:hypothetical protein
MANDILKVLPGAQTIEQWTARQRWDYRAVLATGARTTRMGAIVLAVLGKSRTTRCFGQHAVISSKGRVITTYTDKDGHTCYTDIGTPQELADSFSELADILKLSDEDRIAMFSKVRAWISADARVIQEPLHFTKTQ